MLKLLLAAAGFLLFASAAHAQPYLTCEGDSQTAARVEGPPDDQTWCAIVAQKLGWFHVNYAVSGSKIQDVLWRLNHELGAPGTCVVVMIGANDAYVPSTTAQNNASAMAPEWKLPAPGGTTLSVFDVKLTQLITRIRGAGKTPVLVTPWPFWTNYDIVQFEFYVRDIQNVGARMNVPVIDVFHSELNRFWNIRGGLLSDYLDQRHPNASGHARIAALFTQERYKDACAYHP